MNRGARREGGGGTSEQGTCEASCAPAVKLTPLLCRWLRLAVNDERCVRESDTAAVQFLTTNLWRLNGRSMWDKTPV